MTKFNERFTVASDTINVHTAAQQTPSSWWADYASPGIPQSAFYLEAARQDRERFSRQPREIPVFTDQRFGAIKTSRTNMEAD